MLSSAPGGDGTPPPAERDGAGRCLVQIDGDDGTRAAAFGALLHFVYGDVLPPPPLSDSDVVGGGVAATRAADEMLGAARHRYGMERMCLLCERALCDAVVDATRTADEMLGAAHRYGMERMRLLCERALCDAVVDAATATAALAIVDRHGSRRLAGGAEGAGARGGVRRAEGEPARCSGRDLGASAGGRGRSNEKPSLGRRRQRRRRRRQRPASLGRHCQLPRRFVARHDAAAAGARVAGDAPDHALLPGLRRPPGVSTQRVQHVLPRLQGAPPPAAFCYYCRAHTHPTWSSRYGGRPTTTW